VEAKQFLQTYGIPVTEPRVANQADEAADLAQELGFPVVLKVLSPDVTHKSDEGGVLLRVQSASEAKQGFEQIRERAEGADPPRRFAGVTVQQMLEDIDYELILGAKRDPLFGAVLLFGRGGTGVELYRDTAVGFPPLNQTLAQRLMEETKVYRLLRGYRNAPAVDERELQEKLVRFSQLVIDFPEIREIDVNPLAVKGGEFVALDARMVLDPAAMDPPAKAHPHLVIEPYPRKHVERWQMASGQEVTLRPIRPEDEPLEFALFDTFSEETYRQRFFGPRLDLSHQEMTQFTNIDYRRTMALVGILEEEGEARMIGVARLVMDPTTGTGEYAIVIGDPWQEQGLGEKLTDKMIGIAREKGVHQVRATVLKSNRRMLELCRKMGFEREAQDRETVDYALRLEA
jgi:acetyltransferase